MDITGFRGRGRINSLMPATYDPKRKSRSEPSISLATRATLLLLVLLALWVLVHRTTSRKAAHGAAQGGGTAAVSGHSKQAPAAGTLAAAANRSEALMQARVERAMRIIPSYRGPGKVEMFPYFGNANRLLLATHGRLMWYRYDTDDLRVLHEGQGVYYGVFTGAERGLLGEPTSLWVVSRPHNWHPTSNTEWLLHLDMESGRELGRVQIPSRFTHDAVRRRDHVYVCNTGEGRVLELGFPDMTQMRELDLFSLREHVNTLAPTPDGKLWAVLHNLGNSSLVQVDLATGKEVSRLPNVGSKAHGLVFWSKYMLVLDSDGGALLLVDPAADQVQRLWQLGDPRKFLKGLCVVDDIAFFGIAQRMERGSRADPSLSCELAAYDLRASLLLWRRQLPTRGLLNIVAAPHLAVESTAWSLNTPDMVSYRGKQAYADALEAVRRAQLQQEHEAQGKQQVAQGTHEEQHEQHSEGDGVRVDKSAVGGMQEQHGAAQGHGAQQDASLAREQQQEGLHQASNPLAQQQQQQLTDQHDQKVGPPEQLAPLPPDDPLAQFPPHLDSVHWSSGLPRLLLTAKDARRGFGAGVQLRLHHADVAGLRAELAAMPDADWDEDTQRASNAWVEGRSGVLNRFKPGSRSIMLLFSDQDGGRVYRFPWYDRFARWVEPLVEQVLGRADMDKMMRLQLAHMPPAAEIKQHVDAGGYSRAGHRIHVVVQSNPDVRFQVCQPKDASLGDAAPHCLPLHVEPGLVFELNNRLPHTVANGGDQPRIHLILDVAETPRQRTQLRVGELCRYVDAVIVCEAPQRDAEDQQAHGGGDVLRR